MGPSLDLPDDGTTFSSRLNALPDTIRYALHNQVQDAEGCELGPDEAV